MFAKTVLSKLHHTGFGAYSSANREAKNPGPAPKRRGARDLQNLENVQLVRAETSALGERLFSQFCMWIDKNLGEEARLNCFSGARAHGLHSVNIWTAFVFQGRGSVFL